MKLFHIKDEPIRDKIKNSAWNYKIPGGFLTNFPQRKVNVYGDGKCINDKGKLYGHGWEFTQWTASINSSNISLGTESVEIPPFLSALVPEMRRMFLSSFSNVVITDNTFNLCVCNYYIEPTMGISAHRDGDIWYPVECDEGAVFASLTIYPDGIPERYARFQVKLDGKWEQVDLPDMSVLIMNSDIEHRVMPYLQRDIKFFKPRINITFRSTYNVNKNPLLHAMSIANHNRYYRIPSKIYFSPEDRNIDRIKEAYKEYKISYHHKDISKTEAKKLYLELCKKFGFDITPFKNNMVKELIIMVCEYIENNYLLI